MQITALSWLVYDISGSAMQVGLTGFVRTVPFILITLYAGTVVDRVDRRRLLMWIEGMNMVLTLALGIIVASGQVQLWHIYLVNFGIGAVAAFEAPARSSLLPYLVPKEDLMTAVSLNSSVRKGSQVIGPALGGLFVASYGVAGAFFIHSGAYCILMACLFMMRSTNPIDERTGRNALQSIVDGFKYVAGERPLLTLLVLQSTVSLFGAVQPMMVVFAKDIYGSGAIGLGLLQSAVGVGAIAGSMMLAMRGDIYYKGRLIFWSGVCFGLSMIAFSQAPSMIIAMPLLVLCGFFDMLVGTSKQTLVQLMVDRRVMGRVMSLNSIAGRGFGQASGFQSGAITSVIGVQAATAIGGTICLLAIFVARFVSPAVFSFTGSGTLGEDIEREREESRRSGGGPSGDAALTSSGAPAVRE